MALRINHKDNSIQFDEVAAPDAPPAGTSILYVDATSKLHVLSDGGDIAPLTEIVEDTSPVLGANLDVGGFRVQSATGLAYVQLNDTQATIKSANLTGQNGAPLAFFSGSSDTGQGGAITIQAANGDRGGNVDLSGGTGVTNPGGNVNLISGSSTDERGGDISLIAGVSTNDTGGNIKLHPGDGTGALGGYIQLGPADSGQGVAVTVRFTESGPTTSYIGLKAPDIVTTNRTWVLPQTAPVAGGFVTTDGSGNLAISGTATSYLTLDDTTTTLHAGGALTLESVGNISIFPDSAATSASTTVKGGQATAGAGGDLNLTGGQGSTDGGDVVITPGAGSTVGNIQLVGEVAVTGNLVSHIDLNPKTVSYTLLLTDDGKLITMNTTDPTTTTLTIPANGSVAFPVGTQILVTQLGTGAVTIAITTDTLRSAGSLVSLAGQYSSATLIKIAATEWLLAGDLA